jgi:hypothetical protein
MLSGKVAQVIAAEFGVSEVVDVVLLSNDVLRFAETLTVACRTRRIIWAPHDCLS